MPGLETAIVTFGPYRLERQTRSLTRDGVVVPLGGRSFDTLALLAAAAGETVSKDALLAAVWPGLTVEENNLQVQISTLRKMLGDGWIVTVPGRGYRLASPAGPTPAPAAAQAGRPSLAVLPFANLSGEPDQDYFTDGMVEEITTALSCIDGLLVIARSSAFAFRGKATDVKSVGRALGVRYVMEGSVQKSGDKVRITCQLIETETATHVWARRFDGVLSDIFALQDAVTESVAGAIEPSLRGAEIRRALTGPTNSSDAYELYLRGLHSRERHTRDDNLMAARYFRQALAIDPAFVLARATLAHTLAQGFTKTWYAAGSEEVAECVAAAHAAIDNAGNSTVALSFAGVAVAYVGGDISKGRAALDRALAVNPNSAMVLNISGWIHLYGGQWALAADEFSRALRLSPLDHDLRYFLVGRGLALAELGDLQSGYDHVRRGVDAGRGVAFGYSALTHVLVLLGRMDEARAAATELEKSEPGLSIAMATHHLAAFQAEYRARRLASLRAAGISE